MVLKNNGFYDGGWNVWGDMIKYSPAPKHRRNLVLKLIGKFKNEGKKLHDIGCGNGWLLYHIKKMFPDLYLSGSDISSSVILQNINLFPAIEFTCRDIEETVPLKNHYDIITCVEVLEHVRDIDKAMTNIVGLLKENGLLIITVPRGKIFAIDKIMGHLSHFDSGEDFKKYGFKVIYEMFWGFPFFNIYKLLINLFPERMNKAFCISRYGSIKKGVANLIYYMFFLNLDLFGKQLIVVLKKCKQ